MTLADSMNSSPVTCPPDASVQQAARMMGQNRVGSVVVVDEAGRPVGIVTDRDLAVRVVGLGRSGDTAVSEVMTAEPVTIAVTGSLADAVRQLATRGCRRLPVVDPTDRRLVGVFSLDDALLETIENAQAIARVVGEERGDRLSGLFAG